MFSEANRRIAQNTFFLYVRMIITMIVSLYTSRVVLNILGIDNFGIYNIIGGIVVLFSFLNNAMSNATQRFLSYEIGCQNFVKLKETFGMSVTCHLIIALVVLLLAETIGLWFVSTQLNIPLNQRAASLWVYQFSVFSFVIGILKVPYNATIISYEKMAFYAYMSIIEVVLKLIVAYLLLISPFDKLVFYSVLMFLVSILSIIVYVIYCRLKFDICRYKSFWDKKLFTRLMSYSGWAMLGSGSVVTMQQGGNVLINVFSGVAANAAYGIANQVSQAIYSFVSNFQIAFQPQIVKLYASGSQSELFKLIIQSSKFSYFLLLLVVLPFMLNVEYILELWLVEVPDYAVSFCVLLLIYFLIDAIQAPLWMALGATGKIRNYTVWLSVILMLNIPISIWLLYNGAPLISVFVVRIVLNFITAVIRTFCMKYYICFSIKNYLLKVVLLAVWVTVLALGFSLLLKIFLSDIYVILSSVIVTVFVEYVIGLTKEEKLYIKSFIKKKILWLITK